MSPQVEQLKVPPTLTLARRSTHDPRSDERPLLRDDRGRVLAVVDSWSPATAPN